MFFILLLTFTFSLFAQELELTTNNVQVYARVKNCIDFYLCAPYEETLKIENGYYHWKAEFRNSLPDLQSAFNECSVGNLKFDITIRDENGVARRDFKIPRTPLTPDVERYLLPMELYSRTFSGLKAKEKSMEILLQSNEPLTAMKSTSFEMEYPLGDYKLHSYPISKGNVLAITDHLKKIVVYDLDKWDGSLCRFYEVMRHEIQHVRNFRKRMACKHRHHFSRGNHDERSTYLNDLVFLKTYCPDNKALYQNVESILLKMYQNKDLQTCGVGEEEGTAGTEPSKGAAKPTNPSGIDKLLNDFAQNPLKSRFRERYRNPVKRPSRSSNPNALH